MSIRGNCCRRFPRFLNLGFVSRRAPPSRHTGCVRVERRYIWRKCGSAAAYSAGEPRCCATVAGRSSSPGPAAPPAGHWPSSPPSLSRAMLGKISQWWAARLEEKEDEHLRLRYDALVCGFGGNGASAMRLTRVTDRRDSRSRHCRCSSWRRSAPERSRRSSWMARLRRLRAALAKSGRRSKRRRTTRRELHPRRAC